MVQAAPLRGHGRIPRAPNKCTAPRLARHHRDAVGNLRSRARFLSASCLFVPLGAVVTDHGSRSWEVYCCAMRSKVPMIFWNDHDRTSAKGYQGRKRPYVPWLALPSIPGGLPRPGSPLPGPLAPGCWRLGCWSPLPGLLAPGPPSPGLLGMAAPGVGEVRRTRAPDASPGRGRAAQCGRVIHRITRRVKFIYSVTGMSRRDCGVATAGY
jgi:hypothetical protein